MKNIKIFIAGATNLRIERLSLKALTNDLNAKYHEKGISMSMSSYEDFEDRQSEYNDFIANKAVGGDADHILQKRLCQPCYKTEECNISYNFYAMDQNGPIQIVGI